MNYTKANLYCGMMQRVQRQNDRLFSRQTENYNKEKERISFIQPIQNGGFGKSGIIEPNKSIQPIYALPLPNRILIRRERFKRRY